MPADQIPGPTRSRNLMEAHFKSLRAFRKWCRYMPMFVAMHKYEHFTTPEQAKLQLARVWRQNGKIREPGVIDEVVRASYERLYSAQQIDFWGGQLLDLIAPAARQTINSNTGYSTLHEKRYGGKSDFLKSFYDGGMKPNF